MVPEKQFLLHSVRCSDALDCSLIEIEGSSHSELLQSAEFYLEVISTVFKGEKFNVGIHRIALVHCDSYVK